MPVQAGWSWLSPAVSWPRKLPRTVCNRVVLSRVNWRPCLSLAIATHVSWALTSRQSLDHGDKAVVAVVPSAVDQMLGEVVAIAPLRARLRQPL